MRRDNRFDEFDKAALYNALIATNVCPLCRGTLVASVCQDCKKRWPDPQKDKDHDEAV